MRCLHLASKQAKAEGTRNKAGEMLAVKPAESEEEPAGILPRQLAKKALPLLCEKPSLSIIRLAIFAQLALASPAASQTRHRAVKHRAAGAGSAARAGVAARDGGAKRIPGGDAETLRAGDAAARVASASMRQRGVKQQARKLHAAIIKRRGGARKCAAASTTHAALRAAWRGAASKSSQRRLACMARSAKKS